MTQLQAVGVILLLVIFSCAKVILQGRISRRMLRNPSDSLRFHTEVFVFTALLLGVFFPPLSFPAGGWLMASAAGAFSAIYQVTYAAALRRGSVSMTVLISNFNTILVAFFSIIVFKEPLFLSQALGIACLIVSMILVSSKGEVERCDKTHKWFFLALFAMLSCAAASILMKLFAKWGSESVAQSRSFVSVMYFFAAIVAALLHVWRIRTGRHEKSTYPVVAPRLSVAALAMAAVLGGYQLFYTLGLSGIDGGFLYPTYAGAQSVLMTVIGVLFFGDRLDTRQRIGTGFGIACVVLMNWNFIPLV